MANETIEDIVRDVRHVSELHGMSYKDDKNWHLTIHNYTRILADRIEAVHKAESVEVVRLKAALEKIAGATAVTNLCIIYECPYVGDDSVMCSGCEYCSRNIARAALAAEGGAK